MDDFQVSSIFSSISHMKFSLRSSYLTNLPACRSVYSLQPLNVRVNRCGLVTSNWFVVYSLVIRSYQLDWCRQQHPSTKTSFISCKLMFECNFCTNTTSPKSQFSTQRIQRLASLRRLFIFSTATMHERLRDDSPGNVTGSFTTCKQQRSFSLVRNPFNTQKQSSCLRREFVHNTHSIRS